jgi:hypothetical protein
LAPSFIDPPGKKKRKQQFGEGKLLLNYKTDCSDYHWKNLKIPKAEQPFKFV